MPDRDGKASQPGAGISGQLEGLSPEQLELLSLRLARTTRTARREGAAEGVQAPIPKRRENGPSPLSFAQQRIWILAQLAGDPAAYNLPQTLRLAGPLDPAALAASLQAIFDRHEILRARFFTVDGLPHQEITPAGALELPFVDLSGLPREARSREEERLARADALRPFDLTAGTLLRALLVRLGEVEHLLLVNLHHIAADNLAVDLLVRELSALYTARVAGRGDPLPPPPLQYLDYVAWQRGQAEAEVLAGHLAYWKDRLAGLPALDLPTDRPRETRPRFRGERLAFDIPPALAAGLEAWARRQGGTLHMALVAAWGLTLGRFAGQTDFAVGMPLASRNRRELEGAIGLFSNTVVLRFDLAGDPPPRAVFEKVREATLAAHVHQDLPFDRLVEELAPARVPGRTPLFQTAFNLQRSPGRSLRLGELELTPVEYFRGTANLDLYLAIEEAEGTSSGLLEVDADLFDPATARALNDAFLGFLEALVERPDLPLSRQPFPEALVERARAARLRDRRQQVRIAATFTAEPLERPLAFWLDLLDLPSDITFAPYNQVLQELLDPAGGFATNAYGANVALVRLEDFLRFAPPGTDPAELPARAADDLARALTAGAAARLAVPLLVVFCPSPLDPGGRSEPVRRLEREVAEAAVGLPGVLVIPAAEIEARYPARAAFDDYADRQGHIPYSAEGFAAVASTLARHLYGLRQPPLKVIAVDCDNTLWRGVAAEVGALGVEVGPAHRSLQEFLVGQTGAGRLVCLVSKNRPEDVFEVFDHHPDMLLSREHVTAAKIGWNAKSEGLRALARELSLGLDSFAFLDDNPVECAEVRAALPEVLTLELPAEPGEWPSFLEHVWAFDLPRTATAEDATRTDLYRQNALRETLRGRAATLAEFLEELGLEVDCHPIRPDEIPRVSQLTERTNQWNASTRRRSEAEIAAFLGDGEGLAVSVRDRFGDYGLVGVALFCATSKALEIDTLLLSCRVLGRRVEHRLVARLGELAEARGIAALDIPFRPTPRNRPVRDFLESLPAERREDAEGAVFRLAARAAAGLAAAPDPTLAAEPRVPAAHEGREPATRPGPTGRSELVQRIARELALPAELARLAAQMAAPSLALSPAGYVAPRNPLEEAVAEIWQEVLGVERVGVHDNFLTAGGHSLLGTVLLSRVYDAFGIELPLYTLFAAPTVAALSAQVEERLIAEMDAGDREAGLAEIEGLSPEELRLRVEEEAERVGSGRTH